MLKSLFSFRVLNPNFFAVSQFSFSSNLVKSNQSSQISNYDPTNHSLLKQVYIYPYGEKSCGTANFFFLAFG